MQKYNIYFEGRRLRGGIIAIGCKNETVALHFRLPEVGGLAIEFQGSPTSVF